MLGNVVLCCALFCVVCRVLGWGLWVWGLGSGRWWERARGECLAGLAGGAGWLAELAGLAFLAGLPLHTSGLPGLPGLPAWTAG